MNEENDTFMFTSCTNQVSPELAALDAQPNAVEQPRIQIENCYVVYPDRDNFDYELILADPGKAGQQAINERFERLKWAMDLDELAATIEIAKQLPMFTTGPYWFNKPRHFLFIAIKDGGPVAKFMVEATDLGRAIRRAAKAAPGCQFNIVGCLEHFQIAGEMFLAILNGGDDVVTSMDLRTREA